MVCSFLPWFLCLFDSLFVWWSVDCELCLFVAFFDCLMVLFVHSMFFLFDCFARTFVFVPSLYSRVFVDLLVLFFIFVH